MATVNELIFNIKQILSLQEYKEEFNFTDSYILFLINSERANIFNKVRDISDIFYQRLIIQLVRDKELFISKDKIPNIIGYSDPQKEFFTIRNLYINNKIVSHYLSPRLWDLRNNSKFTKQLSSYTIIDNYLLIDPNHYDLQNIEYVELEAIFSNPLDVHMYNNPEFVFMEDDFIYPLPDKYVSFITENIFRVYIKNTYTLAQDQINNKQEN